MIRPAFPIPASLLLFCLAILALLAGCAGLGRPLEKPAVSLADIQLQELKSLEAAFLVQLRVINPNERVLQIDGINCNLEVDGRHFASGISGEPRQVPAYGSALVPVEVYASVLDMVNSAVGVLKQAGVPSSRSQPLQYQLSGIIRLGTAGLPDQVPFTNSGELNLQQLP